MVARSLDGFWDHPSGLEAKPAVVDACIMVDIRQRIYVDEPGAISDVHSPEPPHLTGLRG